MPTKKTTAKKTTAKSTAKKSAVKKTATAKKAPAKKKTATKKATNVTKSTAKKQTPPPAPPQPKSALDGFAKFTPYEPTEGEEYMSPPMAEHFRNILRAWRQELMEEVDRTVHHMQDEAANFPDPNDRATQESEFSMELRTRDRERKLLRKIDQTLDKIDDEEYGYCEACGIEIGIRRLEARPTATLCIDCKTLDEIREKQMG